MAHGPGVEAEARGRGVCPSPAAPPAGAEGDRVEAGGAVFLAAGSGGGVFCSLLCVGLRGDAHSFFLRAFHRFGDFGSCEGFFDWVGFLRILGLWEGFFDWVWFFWWRLSGHVGFLGAFWFWRVILLLLFWVMGVFFELVTDLSGIGRRGLGLLGTLDFLFWRV